MKIIALKKISRWNTNVIVEMTEDELQTLIGQRIKAEDTQSKEFDIKAGWEAVNSIRTAETRVQRFVKEMEGVLEDVQAACHKLPELTGVKS